MQKSVPIDTPQIFTEYYCILFIIVFNNDLDVNYKFYDFLMAKILVLKHKFISFTQLTEHNLFDGLL